MADEISVNVSATEDVSDTMHRVAQRTGDAMDTVASAAEEASEAMDDSAQSSGRLSGALDHTNNTVGGLTSGIGGITDAIGGFVDMQNASKEKAMAMERAQADVAQALLDVEQAATDAKQAQLDFNQAQIDSKQAAADAEQAALDVQQALLDQAEAQKAYDEAVKEHGATSAEAKQASQDLKQANQDLKQANIDLEQAQADSAQATQDQEQAQRDLAQSGQDAKDAQLGLRDAQKEVANPEGAQSWLKTIESFGPALLAAAGAMEVATVAQTALSAAFIKNTAAAVGNGIAAAALAVKTGIATAAQWVWNLSLWAFPLTWIVAGIIALIAVIVLIATKTTWFQQLWHWIWGAIGEPVKAAGEFIKNVWNAVVNGIAAAVNWVKNAIVVGFRFAVDFVVGYFRFVMGIPGQIARAFQFVAQAIFAPFKWAFNMISWAWNNTVGRLSFSFPDWIPGIGGRGFSVPRLPSLAKGGEILQSGLVFAHKGERVLPASTRGLFNDVNNSRPSFVINPIVGAGAGAAIANMLNELIRTRQLWWEVDDSGHVQPA